MASSNCPKCAGEYIARVSRRGALEQLLSRLYVYPFRCQMCGHRFKLLRWREVYRKTYYDEREFKRQPVSLTTAIWAESGQHCDATLQNLSIRGCRLAGGSAFGQGSILRLELHIPDDTLPIVVQAAVVRNAIALHSEIEFLQLQPPERERLRAFLRSLFASRKAEAEESVTRA